MIYYIDALQLVVENYIAATVIITNTADISERLERSLWICIDIYEN